ncbi:MAG TPA: hypothetical protein VEP90_25990, partial [Methylomirabilota bacterium]|nr:hypothetical protein [Methylomirabilota bacterium]
MSASLKIIQPEVLGLGNSKAPQLEPQDQQRVHAVSESISSQEEAEPSRIREGPASDDDFPIGENKDDNELSTLIGERMTTTLTKMNVAHAQGGGAYLPVENPMNPSPSIQQQLENIHQTPTQALAEQGRALDRQGGGGGPPPGPLDDDDEGGGGGGGSGGPGPPGGEGPAFVPG